MPESEACIANYQPTILSTLCVAKIFAGAAENVNSPLSTPRTFQLGLLMFYAFEDECVCVRVCVTVLAHICNHERETLQPSIRISGTQINSTTTLRLHFKMCHEKALKRVVANLY